MYKRGKVQKRGSIEGELIMNYLVGRIRASSLHRRITVIKLKISVQHARIPWMVYDILEWVRYHSETDEQHVISYFEFFGLFKRTYRIRMNYLI
jgi:hypothetical protein